MQGNEVTGKTRERHERSVRQYIAGEGKARDEKDVNDKIKQGRCKMGKARQQKYLACLSPP